MSFLDKALKFVSGETKPEKKKRIISKPKIKKVSKKKSVKKVKTIKKQRKTAVKKTVKKVKKPVSKKQKKKPAKKKPVKKIVSKKSLKKKVAVKRIKKKPSVNSKKKIVPLKKPEILEEKLPKKRALKLIAEPEVLEFIIELAGEEGYQTYKYLVTVGKEIDEYTLADKVELQINFVRSLLYKLYDHKLVSFFRERDKKKGWFIYSWVAHPAKMKYILIRKKEDRIEKLEREMLKQQDNFYCKNCNKNFEYTQAIENMFFCQFCGSQLEAMNVSEMKLKLKKEINSIKKEIDELKKI